MASSAARPETRSACRELFGGFVAAMAIGLLCIYAVLVLLFHDFIQPLTILGALPQSVGGALAGLLIVRLWVVAALADRAPDADGHRHEELDPAGRVRGDGAERVHGMSRIDALIDACAKRARPIVMTTIAMIAGMLPVAAGFSADPSFRSPMGIAVIGGLITSTALSLFVVPTVYTLLDDFREWLSGRLRKAPAEGPNGEIEAVPSSGS